MFTPEEFNEWYRHPVTQYWVTIWKKDREEIRDRWEAGGFSRESVDETAMLNAEAVGRANAYNDILEEIKERTRVEEDDKTSWPQGVS